MYLPERSSCIGFIFRLSGDSILLEDHTYFATPSVLHPYGCHFIPVVGDQDGLRPDSLWQRLTAIGQPGTNGLPKAIYINPTGKYYLNIYGINTMCLYLDVFFSIV